MRKLAALEPEALAVLRRLCDKTRVHRPEIVRLILGNKRVQGPPISGTVKTHGTSE